METSVNREIANGSEPSENVPDSTEFGSELDLFDVLIQPLDLPFQKSSADQGDANKMDFDSDETMLSDVSEEIPFVQSLKILKPIRISQQNSAAESTKVKRRKKRSLRWTSPSSQFVQHKTSVDSLNQATKKHYSQMEKLNIVEARLSSIRCLISVENMQYIAHAETVLNGELQKSLKEIELSIDRNVNSADSVSDSESSDEDEKQLLEVRKKRLKAVFAQFQEVHKVVEEKSRQCCTSQNDESFDVDASQSLLKCVKNRHMLKTDRKFPMQKLKFSPKLVYIMDKIPAAAKTTNDHSYAKQRPMKTHQVKLKRESDATKPIFTPKIGLAHPQTRISDSSDNVDEYDMDYDEDMCVKPAVAATSSVPRCLFSKPSTSKLSIGCSGSVLAGIGCNSQIHSLVKGSSQKSKHQMVKLKPVTEKGNAPQTVPCLESLVKIGAVRKGKNVLKAHVKGMDFFASVTNCGLILSNDYNVYASPEAWLQAVTKLPFTKQQAYDKIFFNGESLAVIQNREKSRSKVNAGVLVSQKHTTPVLPAEKSKTTSASYDLSDFLRKCTFALPGDDELFFTRNLLGPEESEFLMLGKLLDNCLSQKN